MSVSSMKPVGQQFHQSGGNRHFRKAQLHDADRQICYPDLNQAVVGVSRTYRLSNPIFWGEFALPRSRDCAIGPDELTASAATAGGKRLAFSADEACRAGSG